MYELLKLAVTTLVLPPGGSILLVLLGVLASRRHSRIAWALAFAGAAALWLFSMPVVSGALVGALGGGKALDLVAAKNADAIVILGGGVRKRALEYGGDTLGRLTLERVRYGAFLARRTGLPVLVTGGAPDEDTRAEGELMREALEREYGIQVRWTDSRARTTSENAANAAAMLAVEGKRRAVVVMHGFDVRRANKLFMAAGLEVIAAPTQVPRWDKLGMADFLPSAIALGVSHFALYEVLALCRDMAREIISDRVARPGSGSHELRSASD